MSKTKKIAFCGLMTAVALGLSFMERFIPLQMLIPLPGVKLGLANIVTLVLLYLFKPRYAFAVLVPRCLLGAIFGGGVTGLLFSLTGGVLALLVMILAKKCPWFSVYGVSILGAAAHNVGQILAAMVLLKSYWVGAYLPWLLLTALLTGTLIGAAGKGVIKPIMNAPVSAPAEMSR